MTISTHTPAPWAVDNRRSIVKIRTEKREIAVLSGRLDSEHGRETIQANAEFIVKAVNSHTELLDALERMIYVFDKNIPNNINHEQFISVNSAKEAIAKARG